MPRRSPNPNAAENQPWWEEFEECYGAVPLRALARRFETNPRRLRRAAQRAGLTKEPQSIKDNAHRLGTLPDASLADQLGVTPELIKGARSKRGIRAFDPSRPPPKPRRRKPAPSPAPRPRRPRYRPDPDAVDVVVRRKQGPESPKELPRGVNLGSALGSRSGKRPDVDVARRRIAAIGARLDQAKQAADAPQTSTKRRRRRIVKTDHMEELRGAPDPKPASKPRRRRPSKPAPARTVFDQQSGGTLPPELAPPPTAKPEPTPKAKPEPKPTPKAKPKPEPKPTPKAKPEPKPTPKAKPEPTPKARPETTPKARPEPAPKARPEAAPRRLWQARVRVGDREELRLVSAASLEEVGRLLEGVGVPLKVEPAPLLSSRLSPRAGSPARPPAASARTRWTWGA